MSDFAQAAAATATEVNGSVENTENSDLDIGSEPVETASTTKEPVKKAEEIKKQLKKLKIKYNNKEEELEYDPDDEEFMRKQFQMAKLGTAKSQDYSQLEKEVIAFVDELRKNPRKALANPSIGVDIKKLAAEIIQEEIEASQKSPQELERDKLESELRALKDERNKEKEVFRAKELERLQEQEFGRYSGLMDKAFKDHNVPKNDYMTKRIADYMIMGLQENMKLEPSDVLPLVKDEMMSDLKDMFAVMPADALKEVIGKENLDKIRKYNLSKSKDKPPVPVGSSISDVNKVNNTANQKVAEKKSIKEMFGI
jgi:hypothetical protein